MKGFTAKADNKPEKNEDDIQETESVSNNSDQLSQELNKLNNLLNSGVLTQEEFEKAKKKILDN